MVIVTGASRGIGEEVVKQLRAKGADVVGTTRAELDLADEKSIERFARSIDSLDTLVNNAGIAMDGFDANVAKKTLQTNLFGPMKLTELLLPKVRSGGKIVNVSSGMGEVSILSSDLQKRVLDPNLDERGILELAREFIHHVERGDHQKHGWPSSAYGVSKALLNAFTRVLAKKRTDLRINSVCPGWVRTNMGGRSAPRSVEEGASGITWAATLPADGPTGGFFRDRKPIAW